MTILALDTSGPVCSVALASDGGLRYEARVVNRLTHSVNLMPMVDEALGRSGLALKNLDFIAAVVGPGSFTGVRIGVAAAQGLARGLGINCLAVNALEAMAAAALVPDTIICPIRDARAGQVYGAAFLNGGRLMPDAAMKLEAYLDVLGQFGNRFYFLGDGVAAQGENILARLGGRAVFATPALVQPGAAQAAMLACANTDKALAPSLLKPLYLRAPQAERLRKELHGEL